MLVLQTTRPRLRISHALDLLADFSKVNEIEKGKDLLCLHYVDLNWKMIKNSLLKVGSYLHKSDFKSFRVAFKSLKFSSSIQLTFFLIFCKYQIFMHFIMNRFDILSYLFFSKHELRCKGFLSAASTKDIDLFFLYLSLVTAIYYF